MVTNQTPEEYLASLKVMQDAVRTRRSIQAKERRARATANKHSAISVARAIRKAEKVLAAPDPELTPERIAERKAERLARPKAPRQPRLPGRTRGGAIGPMDVALVLALRDKKATQVEIAKVLNINVLTVVKVLEDFHDTRPIAKAYLQKQANTIAEHAVNASLQASLKGNADPALELLDRLDVAPKRVEVLDSGKVMVIVGSSNHSALPSFPNLTALPLPATT